MKNHYFITCMINPFNILLQASFSPKKTTDERNQEKKD